MKYAWDTNAMNSDGFFNLYGHISRNRKWKIKNWEGPLRLVHVVDTRVLRPGITDWDQLGLGEF